MVPALQLGSWSYDEIIIVVHLISLVATLDCCVC